MKKILLILMLGSLVSAQAAYTEFYCNAAAGAGTNINSGSTPYSTNQYASINGNWTNTGAIFKPSDGSDPSTNGFVVGDWAAVYIEGSTNLVQTGAGGYIARILTINSGSGATIVLSDTAYSGTKPSDLVGTASIRVGGAWAGPYYISGGTTIPFPFGFMAHTATNNTAIWPRVNLKNGSDYTANAAMTHAVAGPIVWEGYATTVGDGGKAILNGGTSAAAYMLINFTGGLNAIRNMIFHANGGSGNNTSMIGCGTVGGTQFYRCVFRNSRQHGLNMGAGALVVECEAYNNNLGSAATGSGFITSVADTWFVRCYSHDNSTGTGVGFLSSAANTVFDHCISDSNSDDGFRLGIFAVLRHCDAYANGADGFDFTSSSASRFYFENCNLVDNGAWGINSSGSGQRLGFLYNNAFGAGGLTNALGDVNLTGYTEVGKITLAADTSPWVDAANGDFRINLTAVKAAGRGAWNQELVNSPTNTVAFPDIGAVQTASTNSAATGSFHTFAQ